MRVIVLNIAQPATPILPLPTRLANLVVVP
jgi:hypothetical protein